jgi:GT2 family glycosyltransferase
MHTISIITATLNRPSLKDACESVNNQTFEDWHHYVIGDGVLPADYTHPNRTTIGFTRPIGAYEPSKDMPYGTPNPILRWALQHLALGKFVSFLDDDNMYKPEFLQTMLEALANSNAGIAICAIQDLRFSRDIAGVNAKKGSHSLYRIDDDPFAPPWDGYPECGHCDNSGLLVYSHIAKKIGFPKATPDRDAIQDFEFIRACAQQYGWVRVPEKLVLYGVGPNFPPATNRAMFDQTSL